jgi:hypothetical protein
MDGATKRMAVCFVYTKEQKYQRFRKMLQEIFPAPDILERCPTRQESFDPLNLLNVKPKAQFKSISVFFAGASMLGT